MARLLQVSLIVTAISAVVGALIGLLQAQEKLWLSILLGALTGTTIALGCTLIEMAVLSNSGLRLIRRTPPLVLMALRGLAFSAVILFGMSLPHLLLNEQPPWSHPGFAAQFAMSCAIAAIFSIGIEVVRFLGAEASWSLVSVRYARPRLEQRVVMFADVTGSTALGARLGALRFHAFLGEVAGDLAAPIASHGGQVHRYVGDAVIVTWPLSGGVRGGACLACARAMHAALAGAAPRYQGHFDAAPRIRIALHAGEVAAGEMGDWKKEIALLGDVMNTAARIEAAAKRLQADTVLSDALVQRLAPEDRAGLHPAQDCGAPLSLWQDGRADDHGAPRA